MARKIVLVDASPLIGLARVGGLAWLRKLYPNLAITRAVRTEVLAGLGLPGEAEIADAIRRRRIEVLGRVPATPLFERLAEGEASILRAALSFGPNALVIIDDLAARREAQRLRLPLTGTAGVIVEAKRAGLIKRARPVFEQLMANDFRLSSELVEAILAELGEK